VELQASANVAGALGYDRFELRPYVSYSHLFKLEELYRQNYKGPYPSYGEWADITGQIAWTTASYGIRFRYPSIKLSANLNFSYFGKTLYSAKNWSPGYTIGNFSVRKGLLDFGDKGDLEVRFDLINMFDKDYIYGNPNPPANQVTYHMPGRSFYGALIYHF
jgi:hypothetical protein